MTIGERLKKLRKALDLTQQEFSDKLKVSRSNIATYEVGKNNPADAVINLICLGPILICPRICCFCRNYHCFYSLISIGFSLILQCFHICWTLSF